MSSRDAGNREPIMALVGQHALDGETSSTWEDGPCWALAARALCGPYPQVGADGQQVRFLFYHFSPLSSSLS